ncbi:uncharacterized protein RJT20DRAFT_147610 [Scheffersomyces xylosifermentans]|uniref:uncharacterized protein n=1 Tax=Scheffersomyces xylosifermentans TaxID=1304137 RepID=UPI00315E0282
MQNCSASAALDIMSDLDKTKKNHSISKTLPSFFELVQSVPHNEQTGEHSEQQQHSRQASVSMLTSVTQTPQLSMASPPVPSFIPSPESLSKSKHRHSYSYGRSSNHNRDESYPIQFKFPNTQEIGKQEHILDQTRQPTNFSPVVSPKSRKINPSLSDSPMIANEDLRSLIDIGANSIGSIKIFNNLFEDRYSELLAKIPKIQSSPSDVSKFIEVFSKDEIEHQLKNYNSIVSALEALKKNIPSPNTPNRTPRKKAEENITTKAPVTPTPMRDLADIVPSEPKKKKRKSISKKRRLLSGSGGEIIPLKIHAKPLGDSGHSEEVGFGGLNEELSIKPEVNCQHCNSKETPEWRRGPEGSRTLCNACGLFYSKLIKRHGLKEADRVMLKRKESGHVNDRRIS